MCGIVGIAGTDNPTLLNEMIVAVRHRGPDSSGIHTHTRLSLGIQRLSIRDLEFGAQPIYNETATYCVVFNGEIYNYWELRRELEKQGHIFRSSTDTEVIIHLYEEYGVNCAYHLQGMFAFAVADGEKLFLARDRLGIKPLYYTLA